MHVSNQPDHNMCPIWAKNRIFGNKEQVKAYFKALRPSCVPNLGQNPVVECWAYTKTQRHVFSVVISGLMIKFKKKPFPGTFGEELNRQQFYEDDNMCKGCLYTGITS